MISFDNATALRGMPPAISLTAALASLMATATRCPVTGHYKAPSLSLYRYSFVQHI